MGGDNRQQPQSNVIIPDIGAAKYWYVDPNATGVAAPQDVLHRMNPDKYSQPHEDQGDIASLMMNLVGRPSPTPSSTTYDPMDAVRRRAQYKEQMDQQYHVMGPKDVFKTVSMDIGGRQWEVPAVFDNMTDYERNIIQYLPHTQWPQSIHQKIEDNARDNLEQGNDPFGNALNHPVQPKVGF